jgi:hypothetical protein
MLILVCTVGFGILLLSKAIYLLDDEPYRLTIRPIDGVAEVQFRQPGPHLVSPQFRVDLELESPLTLVLDSCDVKIPGGSIEFCDTSPLPGRFRMTIGRTAFDVMEAYMEVNGTTYGWTAEKPK